MYDQATAAYASQILCKIYLLNRKKNFDFVFIQFFLILEKNIFYTEFH